MEAKIKTTKYFDGYKLGKRQIFALVVVGLMYAFDFLDQGLFAVCSPAMQALYGITNEQISVLAFLLMIGQFFGAIAGGVMADKLGRKGSLLISITIFSLASLASAVWQPGLFWLLEVSRFLTGFGTLSALTVAMAYISEMLPSESRGKFQSIVLGTGTLSMPFISLVAAQIVMLPNGWRINFVIGGLMILLVPVALKFLEESPRYYISKGRVEEAEGVMNRCLGIQSDMSEAYENFRNTLAKYPKLSFGAQMKIMFGKGQARQTIICLLFCIGLGTGNVMMGQYQNVFLIQMGLPMASVLMASAMSSFGQPVGEYSSSFVSDKGGRTIPIIFYCAITGVLCLMIGRITGETSPTTWAVLSFLRFTFAAGGMALMMTYIPESFPTSVRASATGYVFGVQRLFIASITLLVVNIYNMGGWAACWNVNSMFWFGAALVVLLFGKKTAKKSLDEAE